MEAQYTIIVPYFDNLKRQKTYGGYKKRDVLNEIKRALDLNQIEVALQWTVELHISGYERDFFEFLFLYIYDFHWADVDICFFLDTFSHALSKKTQKTVRQKKEYDHLSTLNDSELRHMVADLVSKISTLPRRRIAFSSKKVEALHFQMRHLGELIQAPNFSYSQKITRGKDSQEVMIAINEICYYVHQKNMTMINFWMEWLYILEKEMKKKKTKIVCEERPHQQLSRIIWSDWFLIIWNVINHFGFTDKVIFRIYEYFLEHFSIGKKQQWLKIFSYCFYRILFYEPFTKEEINQVNFRPVIITNLLIHRFYKHYFSQDNQITIEKSFEEDIQQEQFINSQYSAGKVEEEKELIIENRTNYNSNSKKTKRELKEEEDELKKEKMKQRMQYLDYEPKIESDKLKSESYNPKLKNYFEKILDEEKEWEKKHGNNNDDHKHKHHKHHHKYENDNDNITIKNIDIPDELYTSPSPSPFVKHSRDDETLIMKKNISLDNFPSEN